MALTFPAFVRSGTCRVRSPGSSFGISNRAVTTLLKCCALVVVRPRHAAELHVLKGVWQVQRGACLLVHLQKLDGAPVCETTQKGLKRHMFFISEAKAESPPPPR